MIHCFYPFFFDNKVLQGWKSELFSRENVFYLTHDLQDVVRISSENVKEFLQTFVARRRGWEEVAFQRKVIQQKNPLRKNCAVI